MTSGAGRAQAAGQGGDQGFTPFASAQVTLTDNYNLSAAQSSDAVARLTAGVGYKRRSGRLQGSASYGLSAVTYASHSGSNTHQHQLQADLDAEWWERKGFVNVTAAIRQAPVSAFGAQPVAGGLPGQANARELTSLSISPRWGSDFGQLRLDLLGQANWNDARGTDLGDGSSQTLTARLSPRQPKQVSWALDASSQRSSFDLGRTTRSELVQGGVFWTLPALDLRLSAQAGVERSNYTSLQTETGNTWSMGVDWEPSARTRLKAQYGQRNFGSSHELEAEYRTARTVWTLFDRKALALGGDTPAFSRFGRLFDILFAQFASAEPDFARRADLVDAYLRDNNLRADAIVATGFLTGSLSVSSRQGASVAWLGGRSDVVATLSRGDTRRVFTDVVQGGDLGASTRVLQTALSVVYTHRFHPALSGNLTGEISRSTGEGAVNQSSNQESLRAAVAGRINSREQWSLGVQHTQVRTGSTSYSENAMTATYGVQF